MYKELKTLWQSSDFAKENLNFRQTVSLLLEKHGYPPDALIKGQKIDCPDLIRDFTLAIDGKPLGYILGSVPFWKSDFFIEGDVLIPRSDSEVLVETAISHLPNGAHFLDICTGSGCLGISILLDRPDLSASLLDISPSALRTAQKNIERHGLGSRCDAREFNLFLDIIPECQAIIMNPPYITKEEMKRLPINVAKEPSLALYGGEDGLDFYRFAANSEAFKGKMLIFEIGFSQGGALTELFGGGEIIKDLNKNDRVFFINEREAI